MKKISRKEQAILTEQKIINTTRILLETTPISKIQIKDICTQANISVGNFYHYFENKQSIIIKILDTYSEQFSNMINSTPITHPKQKILFIFLEFCNIIENLGSELVLELFIFNITSQDYFLLDKKKVLYQEIFTCITNTKQQNILLIDESEESISNTLIIFFRGFLYEWCLRKGSYSLQSEISKQLERYLTLFIKN